MPLSHISALINASSVRNISEIPLPKGFNAGSIVEGPDRDVWVGEGVKNAGPAHVARIDRAGAISVFALPLGSATSVLGSGDGGIWFFHLTGFLHSEIVKMDTSGRFTFFALPAGQCGGPSIQQARNGDMWFSDHCSKMIDRIDSKGVLTSLALPNGLDPLFLAFDATGNLWFTVTAPDTVGRLDKGGHIARFATGGTVVSRDVVLGPDGDVYFVDICLRELVRVNPSGFTTPFPWTTDFGGGRDVALAVGPDRQIWMVSTTGQMKKFDPQSGRFSNNVDLPPGPNGGSVVGDKGIVRNSDGDMWFTSGDVVGARSADYVGVAEP